MDFVLVFVEEAKDAITCEVVVWPGEEIRVVPAMNARYENWAHFIMNYLLGVISLKGILIYIEQLESVILFNFILIPFFL